MDTIIGSDIGEAVRLLKAGELVAIPTETVYGLAGNALNDEAVLKIFAAKERPQFNPLIIHLHKWEQVTAYAKNIPLAAHMLAGHFMPGPITLLLPKNDNISLLVTAGSAKVAVRIPYHPVTRSLLEQISFPLAAPSANRFGYVSPVTPMHVWQGLAGRIPYILDGGPCTVGVESTIVDFENEDIIIRRTGQVSKSAIEALLGREVLLKTHSDDHPVAPGMLKSHYATHTPLYVGHLAELNKQFSEKRRVVLGWGTRQAIALEAGVDEKDELVFIISLSEERNVDEVARMLFATMRTTDALHYDVILAPFFPNEGIGMAINDRLKRAQHR